MTDLRRSRLLLFAPALLSAHLLACASQQAMPSYVPTAPKAHARLAKQCEEKQDLASCLTLVHRYRHVMVSIEEIGTTQQLKNAYKLYSKLCKQGHDEGCHGKAEMLFGTTLTRVDTAQGLRDMKALCEEKHYGESCLFLSELYKQDHRIKDHERVSRELLERACTYGSGNACMKIGYARLKETRQRDFADSRLLIYSRKACSGDDPNTCALFDLVSYYNTTREKQKHLQNRVLERCLQQGHGAYCPVIVFILQKEEPGYPRTPEEDRALVRAYETGCAAHDPQSCQDVLFMLFNESDRLTISRERSRAMVSMACIAGVKEACILPFEHEGKSHEELSQTIKFDRRITETGCMRGWRAACKAHAFYTYLLFDWDSSEVTKDEVIQAWQAILDMYSPEDRRGIYEEIVKMMSKKNEDLLREILALQCHKGDDALACEHVKKLW